METTTRTTKMRSRKFVYRMLIADREQYDLSMKMLAALSPCQYHVFGEVAETDGSCIVMGFLYFRQVRSQTSVYEMFRGFRGCTNTIDMRLEKAAVIDADVRELCNENTVVCVGALYVHNRRNSSSSLIEMMSSVEVSSTCVSAPSMLMSLLEQNQSMCLEILQQNRDLTEENRALRQQQPPPSVTINMITNSTTTTTTTTNNNTTNIHVFLKEQCNDAVTLLEFANNLKIEDEDLLYADNNGYSESITHMIMRGLEQYGVTRRPIHCSDLKRETMHVKEDTGWVQQKGCTSEPIRKAMAAISQNRFIKLAEFMRENPDMRRRRISDGDKFMEFMHRVMGGTPDERQRNEIKSMKQLAKSVHITGNAMMTQEAGIV